MALNNTLVHMEQGGGTLTIESGGVLDLRSGALVKAAGTQASAMTAQLTTITHTAPGTPDYAIQNLTTTTPYGFVTADEGNSVLKVIANLQTRLAEVEAILENLGLCAAN